MILLLMNQVNKVDDNLSFQEFVDTDVFTVESRTTSHRTRIITTITKVVKLYIHPRYSIKRTTITTRVDSSTVFGSFYWGAAALPAVPLRRSERQTRQPDRSVPGGN